MKPRTHFFLPLAGFASLALIATPASAVTVANAGFESNSNANPGYGAINNWTFSQIGGVGNAGVNTSSQPFLNQTPPAGSQAAFIQSAGTLSQNISGFDPTKNYTVTYLASERGQSGASVNTTVSLDGGTTSFSYADTIVKTGNFRRIVSDPLAVSGSSSTLGISLSSGVGDRALLIDSVSVTRAAPRIPDGGFENPVQPNNNTSTRYKLANGGGGGALAGSAWTFGATSGITRNNSDFAPPTAPEGNQAAILRGTNQFSTTVSGFESGVTYSISFEAAGRNGTPNDFKVLLNGVALMFGLNTDLDPTTNAYQSFTSNGFTTSGGSFVLAFEGLVGGDTTAFIDDVRFNFVAEIPEPSSVLLLSLGGLASVFRRRRH